MCWFLKRKATLSGKVTDAKSGKGIEDAIVRVDGSQALTNQSGQYKVRNLEPEPCEITVSKVGYTAFRLSDFVLKPGNNKQDFTLTAMH